jgi:hypothetical protein
MAWEWLGHGSIYEPEFCAEAPSCYRFCMGMTPIQSSTTEEPGPSGSRITFTHAVLAQCGLPRRRVEGSSYERHNGGVSLLVKAGELWNRRSERWEMQSLPYGTRPRLTLFHVSAQAVRTKSRVVEVGHSTREFLLRLGVTTGGREYARFQQQMLALAACDMRLGVGAATIMNAKPISVFEPWHQGPLHQRALLPGTVTLSPEFHASLMDAALPLDLNAISALKGSSLALDVYTWLAHRLRRVNTVSGQRVSWMNLLDQFGEYRTPKDLKRELLDALRAVRAVYPDARVEQVRGGLKLLPSRPPIPTLMVSGKTL